MRTVNQKSLDNVIKSKILLMELIHNLHELNGSEPSNSKLLNAIQYKSSRTMPKDLQYFFSSKYDNSIMALRTLSVSRENIRSLSPESGADYHGVTPCKRELFCLTNNHPAGFDIVITPATLLGSTFRTSTIGILMRNQDRQWNDMPSLIFGIHVNSHNPVLERPGFGNINSFKSNDLFTDEYESSKARLSHFERIEFLYDQLRKSDSLIKKDKFYNKAGIVKNPKELINDLIKKDSIMRFKSEDKAMRHNEFATKLEVMDIIAVEIGGRIDVAIATLIELNYERKLIYDELLEEGIDGEIFNDFLIRQVSSHSRTLDQSELFVQRLSKHTKKYLLYSILYYLKRKITLCRYSEGRSVYDRSSISNIDIDKIPQETVKRGVRLFFESKLGNVSNLDIHSISE